MSRSHSPEKIYRLPTIVAFKSEEGSQKVYHATAIGTRNSGKNTFINTVCGKVLPIINDTLINGKKIFLFDAPAPDAMPGMFAPLFLKGDHNAFMFMDTDEALLKRLVNEVCEKRHEYTRYTVRYNAEGEISLTKYELEDDLPEVLEQKDLSSEELEKLGKKLLEAIIAKSVKAVPTPVIEAKAEPTVTIPETRATSTSPVSSLLTGIFAPRPKVVEEKSKAPAVELPVISSKGSIN
ncbi:MAG TPA: hypothetical protein VD770_03710 [Coxiellaceae bacterium]|nr:hypothetical protein [Coxiellaceae bacterium]